MNNKDFLAEVEATIAYYEQANGYMARRTRQMIAELGEVFSSFSVDGFS